MANPDKPTPDAPPARTRSRSAPRATKKRVAELEAELRAAQDQLRALDRSQAVIEFSPDGTILTANDNFLATMGYDLAEVQGQHHRIFVDAQTAAGAEYATFWARLAAGEVFSDSFRRIGKAGKEVWIQASYNPILDGEGVPYKVVKYATDITAETLEAADHQGQIAAIHRSQAVIEFSPHGTILTANDNFLATLGYTLAEIQGQHHSMFVEPTFALTEEYQLFWARLAAGEVFSDSFRRIGKAGKEVWIQASYNPILDPDGRVHKVVKYATDVTAATLEAADYQGQLDAIGRSQAVIEFTPDGTILTANDNFLGAMGYRLDEVQGQHHSIFVDPAEAASPAYTAFWRRLASGHFASDSFRRLGKGGREVWIQATYNPILDPSGRTYKVVKYATDITRRVQSAAAFREQMGRIVGSASAGDLGVRGELAGLDEELGEVMGSVNQLLDTITDPITVSTEAIGTMARGATPDRIRAPWQGSFGTLRDSINALIDASASVSRTATAIAGGDLTVQVTPRSDDDALLHALAEMVEALGSTMREIGAAAADVDSGSSAVEQAGRSVSDNSTRAAASIEEVSASTRIITDQTKANAHSATQALELARAARATASIGDESMTAMVGAMVEIEEMSNKISKIIKVIDEIAFQTNLLALNAAVEAGRAGQHGKGFVVVADEVGRLAERSAQAARETALIIEDTVVKVASGTRLARDTAERLSEIVEGVGTVSDLVSRISEASLEQADQVAQIDDALTEVDTVIQRNTSDASEMASAAANLSARAQQTTELIGRFQLPAPPQTTMALTPELMAAFQQFLIASGYGRGRALGGG